MSVIARQKLAGKLTFSSASEKTDLLDPAKTKTWLIALIMHLQNDQPHPLLITSLCSDHMPDANLGLHGHSNGWAVDLWHADFSTVGDDKIYDVLKAAASNPYCWTIGLGGSAQKFAVQIGTLLKDPRQVLFIDSSSDHVHLQAGNAYGEGLR